MVVQGAMARGGLEPTVELIATYQRIESDFGVVPRLFPRSIDESVDIPGYLDPGRLRAKPSDLKPPNLPPPVTSEMLDGAEATTGSRHVVIEPGHGASRVENTQRDHFQPKIDVFNRLKELVLAMRIDPSFRDEMLAVGEDYFMRSDGSEGGFEPTKYLEHVFNQTVDNLWFLQSRANTAKKDDPPVEWLLGLATGKSFFEDMYVQVKQAEASVTGEAVDDAALRAEFAEIVPDDMPSFIRDHIVDSHHILLRVKGSEKTLLNAYTDWRMEKLGEDDRTQFEIEKYSFRIKMLVGFVAELKTSGEISDDVYVRLQHRIEQIKESLHEDSRALYRAISSELDRSMASMLSPLTATPGSVARAASERALSPGSLDLSGATLSPMLPSRHSDTEMLNSLISSFREEGVPLVELLDLLSTFSSLEDQESYLMSLRFSASMAAASSEE